VTGIYIRVERDGRWQPVEVEFLTDTEWDQYVLAGKTPLDGWRWARLLARWIGEHRCEAGRNSGEQDAPGQ